jgi:zinc transport system substrate-binding protein
VGAVITRIVLILIAGALALFASGCGAGGGSGGSSRETVVAAFYPLAYAAELVGGRAARVENLTPSGAEPHDLELTPKAVAEIQRADVVLYLSHGFQPAVSDAVKGASGRAIDLLDDLPLHSAQGQEEGLTADPHVWLDPTLFTRIVRRVGAALGRVGRTAAPIARLRALDRAYGAGLAHCARREIVTSHAAFGYLAQRYHLRQVPITGVTPESEPTARNLARVVGVVRRTHATTVFFETLVSPRLADTVAREVGAHTAVLDPIEGLTQSEQARGDTYFTLMRRNLAALRKALACR